MIKLKNKKGKEGIKITYNYDKNYFDIIDTEEKAYWLGFIWGDGYVINNTETSKYSLKIGLSSIDHNHLEKFKKSIKSNHDIKQYKIKTGFMKKDGNDSYESRIVIGGKEFVQNLYNNFGICPHRNDISKIIEKLPKKHYRDFIRGVVDADGGITFNKKKYKVERLEFSIALIGSDSLLDFYNEYLIENNITKTKYKRSKRHPDRDGEMKTIRITGNNIVLNILNNLYLNSNVFLDRKYEKYIEAVKYMELYKQEKGGGMNGKKTK